VDYELILTDSVGEVLLRFQADPFAETDQFTRQELENATYQSGYAEDGTVTLSYGEYFSAISEGAASNLYVIMTNHTAFGDLDGDGEDEAALILVTSTGGSGGFVDLVVMDKQAGELLHLATAHLGDRVIINSLTVADGVIVVDMLTQGPEDGLCCPTQRVVPRYQLQGSELILLEE